ncbi:hypothetical protein Cantr_01725 [Candida viswanathii]|uniref:Subtelomeric hrmA-associated cluster protein AFUB-079030/YDR124W-like helical bundle domain-containing protein n=1 Tax=Candida viswanathii TaxID=5486 RepID=A0A367YLS4_9ASCO|nr:hypothetical protein Cantr_01725 [Candida viswanathii]
MTTTYLLPEIGGIVQLLHKISEDKLIKFMLITQGISPTTEFHFHFSNHFTESQTTDISLILGRSLTNIRPVLNHTKTITLRKTRARDDDVAQQLRDLFNSLNQNVCKDIAKSWIKILEPDKQKYYPYTRKNMKPPWWPVDVVHTEPDHLKKEDRIQVLIHVVRSDGFHLPSVNVNSIRHKVKHTEAIIHEILYICFFERLLLANEGDGEAVDLDDISSWQDKGLFDGDDMQLIVSDLRFGDPDGILQSRIEDEDTNMKTFKLGTVITTTATARTTTSKKGEKSKEKGKLKKVRKQKTVKKKMSTTALSRLETDLRVASSSTVVHEPREGTSAATADVNLSLNLHDSAEGSHSTLETPGEQQEEQHEEHEFAMMFSEPQQDLNPLPMANYLPSLAERIHEDLELVIQEQHQQFLEEERRRASGQDPYQ